MDEQWSDALKEAYANASSEPILATLELRHPSWASPARVVRDTMDFDALIEAGAPANAGTVVTYSACAFDAVPPDSTDKLPEITIRIDNVSREVSDLLSAASSVRQAVEITYREYLPSDAETTGPHYILTGLTLRRATCTGTTVTGKASFGDFANRAFPNKYYMADEFKGLVR